MGQYKHSRHQLTDKDKEKLKSEIMERLKATSKESARAYHPPFSLCKSETYRTIQICLEENKAIQKETSFWDELVNEISLHFPSFMETVLTLSDDSISTREFRLLLLIKCGITPAQTCILFSREKGTLSYHRKKLCTTLFGDTVSLKEMDKLIHCI